MSEKKTKPNPKEVIAMPPLKMVLVHAKNEDANKASPILNLRQSAEFTEEEVHEEAVDPEAVKKLIEHLEKKKKDK